MAQSTPPGTSSTLPSPPFIHLRGIPNFRDLGGWPISASSNPPRSVRRNFIFRCGEPTRGTDDDIAKIKSLGVTRIFDLRSNPEIKSQQISGANGVVTTWPGIERVYCPVFPEESYDPVGLAKRHQEFQSTAKEGMTQAYKTILHQGKTAYARILRDIISRPDEAVLVHCTAGKDRTGVLCAVVLSFCGVEDEIVADEYSLTEQGLGSWIDTLVESMLRSSPGCTREGARRMMGARRESILGALKVLEAEYDGAEGYMRDSLGMDDLEICALRRILIADEAAVCGLN